MADYFLKIDGVAGESLDERHRDQIEVLAFSWGESHPRCALPRRRDQRRQGRHRVASTSRRFISAASPKLMLLGANGKTAKNAVFVARRAGAAQNEYLKVTMQDVTVAAYHLGGDDGEVPVEDISLRFSKIVVEYRPQKPTGALGAAIRMGWDIKTGKEA